LIIRRQSKPIRIGTVIVGGDAPIVVQSMTKTDTRDIKATVNQVNELTDCGCQIARVAIPDSEAAQAISTIKGKTSIPIVADVHFDYRLALEALKAGADGLRLNPGNIREREHVIEVVKVARQKQIPIRIGVNAGSLPVSAKSGLSTAQQMVKLALEQIKLLESLDFNLIKVSLKAFDVITTIEAYRAMAAKIPYPLHLGITEAGLPRAGAVRSAVGIGILLHEGIGDTIRISLSTHPCEEVYTAFEILKTLGLREYGPTLISCPSCGRCEVDITSLAESVDKELKNINKPIKIAVMGCIVNGLGEAKEADVGIACGKGKGAIFRKGKVVSIVAEKDFLKALMAEVRNMRN
jgi:(E)-4-hydroxy-3-methylbut-2-enyl-diphosphate synthase